MDYWIWIMIAIISAFAILLVFKVIMTKIKSAAESKEAAADDETQRNHTEAWEKAGFKVVDEHGRALEVSGGH